MASNAILQPAVVYAADTVVGLTKPGGISDLDCGAISNVFLVESGVCANIAYANGKRCIVGLSLARDYVNIEAVVGLHSGYETRTIGTAKLARMNEPSKLFVNHPQLTLNMMSHAVRAASIAKLWTFRLASLEASRGLAHLLCELRYRVAHHGLAERVLRTPFTQGDIADMCGISAIHANRAFKVIRDAGLGEMRRGDFYTSDWAALEEYGHFDPGVLASMIGPLSEI